ncbi:hypothetical protein [Winogradskyella forsetii]|uniref:hypothetical protein n=1 Tax=Winogradskyella forsetii TaxID=2686077 RepID=UPI0015C00C94|nr:hypothetical protein [Winogradskyella forsetii]
MKTKLHFGIIVILLAFLGTFIEQTTLPNQQIIIQFSDTTVTAEDTENAIEAIQNKLQSIGVSQIQIGQTEKGQFKITYHSDAEVSHIQAILFQSENFKIAYEDSNRPSDRLPENQSSNGYELNISEIKTSSKVNWDFDGVQITEINQKTDHSNPTKVDYSGVQIHTKQSNNIINVALLSNNSVAIAVDNRFYKIPEVRAGPTS